MYSAIVCFTFIVVESRAEVHVKGNVQKYNTEQTSPYMKIGENIWVKVGFYQSLLYRSIALIFVHLVVNKGILLYSYTSGYLNTYFNVSTFPYLYYVCDTNNIIMYTNTLMNT